MKQERERASEREREGGVGGGRDPHRARTVFFGAGGQRRRGTWWRSVEEGRGGVWFVLMCIAKDVEISRVSQRGTVKVGHEEKRAAAVMGEGAGGL